MQKEGPCNPLWANKCEFALKVHRTCVLYRCNPGNKKVNTASIQLWTCFSPHCYTEISVLFYDQYCVMLSCWCFSTLAKNWLVKLSKPQRLCLSAGNCKKSHELAWFLWMSMKSFKGKLPWISLTEKDVKNSGWGKFSMRKCQVMGLVSGLAWFWPIRVYVDFG